MITYECFTCSGGGTRSVCVQATFRTDAQHTPNKQKFFRSSGVDGRALRTGSHFYSFVYTSHCSEERTAGTPGLCRHKCTVFYCSVKIIPHAVHFVPSLITWKCACIGVSRRRRAAPFAWLSFRIFCAFECLLNSEILQKKWRRIMKMRSVAGWQAACLLISTAFWSHSDTLEWRLWRTVFHIRGHALVCRLPHILILFAYISHSMFGAREYFTKWKYIFPRNEKWERKKMKRKLKAVMELP